MSESQQSGELSRRSFLRSLAGVGVGVSGAWLAGCAAGSTAASTGVAAAAALPPAERIGLQLYTVRDQLQQDFEGTLARVAELGFREVEFAGYGNRTPEQVRALLDRLGLRAPSAHIPIDQFRRDLNGVLAAARTVGHQYVTIPFLAQSEYGDLAAWRRLAGEFNGYGEAAQQQGLRFAYHNHSFEFEGVAGGQTGFDVLVRETDPALVDFELDLFWTVNSNRDPVEIFTRYPGRIALWHVKDMADIKGAKKMAPVGEGEIDFGRIFASAELSGMRHFFIEHDSAAQYPGGSLASIRKSIENLKKLLA